MSEDWYYGQGDDTVGPIGFEALLSALRQRPDWRDIQVWCADFDDWRAARNVHQIAFQLRLQPLNGMPKRAATPSGPAQPAKALQAGASRKRALRIAGAIGAAVLALAAIAVAIWQPFTPPLERTFARIIHDTKPALPKKADESVSLMDVTASGTKLVYHHVWDGPRFAIPPNLGPLMKARRLSDICTAAKEIFDLGGSVEYTYRSQSSLFIASFEVTGKDCG